MEIISPDRFPTGGAEESASPLARARFDLCEASVPSFLWGPLAAGRERGGCGGGGGGGGGRREEEWVGEGREWVGGWEGAGCIAWSEQVEALAVPCFPSSAAPGAVVCFGKE